MSYSLNFPTDTKFVVPVSCGKSVTVPHLVGFHSSRQENILNKRMRLLSNIYIRRQYYFIFLLKNKRELQTGKNKTSNLNIR